MYSSLGSQLRLYTWRRSIMLFLLLFLGSSVLAETVERQTTLGTVVGHAVEGPVPYQAFLGVPYAQPPLNELRFLPPLPADHWEGQTLNALEAPPACPQLDGENVVGDEDCLQLSIFTPATGDEKLAVMVFIHGGAFLHGASSSPHYGPDLLISQGVVLVTVNYRLGALGWLTNLTPDAPGNLGLRDLALALKWVNSNIGEYGGDINRVTVFGQSAGSMAISALITMDTEGDFQRAILQSGTLARSFFLQGLEDDRVARVEEFGERLGCSGVAMVACLRGKPVSELVAASAMFPAHTVWQPVIDIALGESSILPVDPLSSFLAGNFRRVDLLFGSNTGDGISQLGGNLLTDPEKYYKELQEDFATEGPRLMLGRTEWRQEDVNLAFRLRYFYTGESVLSKLVDNEIVALMTDNMYQAGGRRIADILRYNDEYNSGEHRIYQYLFSYIGSVTNADLWFNLSRPELGACHGDELYYLFNSIDGDSPLVTEEDQSVSDFMTSAWTQFAKTGDPNPGLELNETPSWPALSSKEDRYLEISTTISTPNLTAEYKRTTSFWKDVLQPELPQRNTVTGAVSGTYLTTVKGSCIAAFQGIPYALPPIGPLRFLDPQPASSWEGVLKAHQPGPVCPQDGIPPWQESEDCLFLNVYSPCEPAEESLPVMIWVHGGSYRGGSGGTWWYGPEYLLDSGVILITLNYRLIPLGFISLESPSMPGNQGQKDVVMALKWIQDNIVNFGGDANRVTVFGESSGSDMVVSLLVSPLASGLFSAVIGESGASMTLPFSPYYQQQEGSHRASTLQLAVDLGCTGKSDQDIVECLQNVPTQTYLKAASSLSSPHWASLMMDADISSQPFMPIYPEAAIQTGQVNEATVMIGFNKDEGTYGVSKYVNDPKEMANLNANWDNITPGWIFGKCCNFSEEEKETSRKMRTFYFGDEDVSLENIHGLIDIFSDTVFWMPEHRAVTLLSSLPGHLPVYEYLFSHLGALSFGDGYGVAHFDEVHYLFNPQASEFPALREEDFTVRDLMVGLWTNFAKTGNPTSSNDFGFQWTPFDANQPEYLNINTNPVMEYSEEFRRRRDFWENLFPPRPLVVAPAGAVLGSWGKSEEGAAYQSYRGIPFGQVVKRFEAPVPAEPWGDNVLEAFKEGAVCPQLPNKATIEANGMSEDCLFLNVFVPGNDLEVSGLPVMVFVHGGGYVFGSGGDFYYGPEFLMDEGIILVTINYRLGALGFLGLGNPTAPGNTALWDQHLALTWVQNNIEAFGGDPARVTLSGESAGSFSVMYHLVSPRGRGLFSGIIAQSGSPFSTYPELSSLTRPDKPRKVATALANNFACDTSSDEALLSCLREQSWEDIVSANVFCQNDTFCTMDPWNAVVDNYLEEPFLPETPSRIAKKGKHNDVPIVIGVNSEEGIFSAARYIKDPLLFSEINLFWDIYGPLYIFDAETPTVQMQEIAQKVKNFYLGEEEATEGSVHKVIDMFSDIIFWAGAERFIQIAAVGPRSPVFQYLLTAKSSNSYANLVLGLDDSDLGVCHADDIYHLFKNHVHNMTFNDDDLLLRDFFLTTWSNFVKTGEPLEGTWSRVTDDSPNYLNISWTAQSSHHLQPHMERSPEYAARMEFWMEILDEMM